MSSQLRRRHFSTVAVLWRTADDERAVWGASGSDVYAVLCENAFGAECVVDG
jgi:hypothetical protein